jgi:hypothetical protein
MILAKISEKNKRALESILEIIEVEEERTLTLDEVLCRLLNHYKQFVPFQTRYYDVCKVS